MYLCEHTHLFPTNFHVFICKCPSHYIRQGSAYLNIFTQDYHHPPHRLNSSQSSMWIFIKKPTLYTVGYTVPLSISLFLKKTNFKCCCLKKYCKKYMPVIIPADVLCICACTSGFCTLYLCLYQWVPYLIFVTVVFLFFVLLPVPAVPWPCTCT